MQIENFRVPLRMNFNSLSPAGQPLSPERALSRQLRLGMDPQSFQTSQRQFSLAARNAIGLAGRSTLLGELGARFRRVDDALAGLGLTQRQTVVTAPAVAGEATARYSAISSRAIPLISSGGGSSPVDPTDPTTPRAIDPASTKLADLPLATPITGGTLEFFVSINGTSKSASVNVDINSDTINSVLSKIIAQAGVNASFDTTSGQLTFDATSRGADFTFELTGGTSNFYQALTNEAQTRTVTSTGGQAVAAAKGGKADYNDLLITYQGQQFTATGLSVDTKSGVDYAEQLRDQINTQLQAQGTNLRASASGGVLSFTATETDARPTLTVDLIFEEVRPGTTPTTTDPTTTPTKGNGKGGNGGGNGGGGNGGGGAATLSLGLDNPNTTTSINFQGRPKLEPVSESPGGGTTPPPAPQPIGLKSSLGDIADALGITSDNGAFRFSIDGIGLAFTENDTLDDVLAGINRSVATVEASFDVAGRRVVLEQRDQASTVPIVAQDIAGNLFGGLGLTIGEGAFNKGASLAQAATTAETTVLAPDAQAALQRAGAGLADALNLLSAATGERGAYRGDALFADLKDAVSGLFNPGSDSAATLERVGLSMVNGEVRFDAGRLASMSSDELAEIDGAFQSLVASQISPLLAQSSRAIADEQARAPLDQRLAQQAVAASAELSRLQQRQQLLLFQQVAFDRRRESLERQDEGLKATQARLSAKPEAQPTEEAEEFPPDYLAERLDPPAAPPVAPPTTGGFPQAPMAPGLGSFGLSG